MKRTIALLLILTVLLGACGDVAPTPTSQPTAVSGRITFAGSTTVQPLAHKIGEAFGAQYPDITLDIAAGGSVVGIEAIHSGTVDIGMASRALKPEEAEGIEVHPIAVDVIAVAVNASNPVDTLTMDQLAAIYLGTITNWSEVGGDDAPITVIMRGSNSGTRGAFDDIVLDDQEPTAPNLETAVTAGDIAAMVGSEAQAIGYVGFGNVEPDIKLVSIDGVEPNEEHARDGSYTLMRPLQLLTGPLTQPLGHLFVEFALSQEGQQIVADNGWVPAR